MCTNRERTQEAENREQAKKQKGWRDWVTEALEGGAKKAHRWINGPSGWAPQYGVGTQADATDPDAVIDAIRQKCRKAWRSGEAEAKCQTKPPHLRTALPRLTPEQIKEAGRASAKHKAIAYDGFLPRHIANSSAEARECVARMWEA